MLMKIEDYSSATGQRCDATLVADSLDGDHHAFSLIVTRYQRLICSLAYSSLGSLNESEDLAQEVFVEAWKKLRDLREPEKLKSWLCGILRFKISHHWRKNARQPMGHAHELPEEDVLESDAESVETSAMKEEEKALLWRSLETVPETYRDTLILYYREHKSLEHVASELDLSEDTVKQRLSRGRKLLQKEMMNFVEGALERSAPGKVFTGAVMAALVTMTPSAKAAGAGITAAKVGSSMKLAGIVAAISSVSGLLSSFFALRANLDQSRTQRERKAVVKTVMSFMGVAAVFVAGMYGLRYFAMESMLPAIPSAILSQALVFGFVGTYLIMTFVMLKKTPVLRTAERLRRPDLFESPDDQPDSKKREYKSRLSLFGLPLIHAKFGMPEAGEKPAVGWIAAGDRAYGLLFAWGGLAVAPISVGIVSAGLITVGAVGIGVVGLGTVGIGALAIGPSAIGYNAFGTVSALGWESAFSPGFSIAKDAALGPIAFANETNSELAASIANMSAVDQFHTIILGLMALLVIVPVILWSRSVRKRFGKTAER